MADDRKWPSLCHLFAVLDSAEPFNPELLADGLVAGCPLCFPDT
jgi:hypothetical protein